MTVGELKAKLAELNEHLEVKLRAEYSTQSTFETVESSPNSVMLVRPANASPYVVIEQRGFA